MLNQRIVRLERAGYNYGAIAQWKDWIWEYYGVSKTGLLRFPEKRKAGTADNWNVNISLRRELDKLEYFAGANWETATVKGAKAVEQRRMERFSEMGLRFPSTKVMNEFLQSESWKTLKKIYGSALAVRLAGKRKFNKGSRGRRSTVQVMDAKLNRFLKRMGDGYDLRNMDLEDIQKIFGLDSQDIMEAIEETEDLP